MAGSSLEGVLYLLSIGWAAVWIGLWFAARRAPRLATPMYIAIPATALPALGGIALTTYRLIGLRTDDDPTFAVIGAAAGLLPAIQGLFVSFVMAGAFLHATRRPRCPAGMSIPASPEPRTIRRALLPKGQSAYVALAIIAVAWLAWLKWPDAIGKAMSNEVVENVFGSAIAVCLAIAAVILRRRPRTGKWRQISHVLPVMVFFMAALTVLGWLHYLAALHNWDLRWQLAFIGIAFFGTLIFQIAWLASNTWKEIRRRREHDPRCGHCGYILYHASGGRCPECGQPFDINELDLKNATVAEDGIIRPR